MKRKVNAIKLWEGPSELDGKPVMVLLTGLTKSSKNTKTGAMLQTWILRSDVPPHEAVKSGEDASVCGQCPLRPAIFNRGEVSNRSCYVKVFQAPLSTWKANRHAQVTSPEAARALIGGRVVRRGSYGDPAAVPSHVWANLSESPGTGYTHQWRNADLSTRVMASVHTTKERDQARALGYRTFRILSSVDEIEKGEILCPASKEAGARVQCSDCSLCNGSKTGDKRKNIAIVAH